MSRLGNAARLAKRRRRLAIARGVGSVLELAPAHDSSLLRGTERDWLSIGGDFRKALDDFRNAGDSHGGQGSDTAPGKALELYRGAPTLDAQLDRFRALEPVEMLVSGNWLELDEASSIDAALERLQTSAFFDAQRSSIVGSCFAMKEAAEAWDSSSRYLVALTVVSEQADWEARGNQLPPMALGLGDPTELGRRLGLGGLQYLVDQNIWSESVAERIRGAAQSFERSGYRVYATSVYHHLQHLESAAAAWVTRVDELRRLIVRVNDDPAALASAVTALQTRAVFVDQYKIDEGKAFDDGARS